METYSREGADGKKQWFYPDEVEVTNDAKGKADQYHNQYPDEDRSRRKE